jgi:hypothetical protein
MANYFPLHSGDSIKITDGIDTLAISALGAASISDFGTYLLDNAVLVIESDVTANAGTNTLYTVPAGKTFYLVSCSMSANALATNTAVGRNFLQTDATGAAKNIMEISTAGSAGGSNPSTSNSQSFYPPLKIPTGKVLNSVKDANMYRTSTTIIGYVI